MNHLADTWREQGNFVEAKGWYEQALLGLTQTLGPDNATTLDTVYNLANLLHAQVLLFMNTMASYVLNLLDYFEVDQY